MLLRCEPIGGRANVQSDLRTANPGPFVDLSWGLARSSARLRRIAPGKLPSSNRYTCIRIDDYLSVSSLRIWGVACTSPHSEGE